MRWTRAALAALLVAAAAARGPAVDRISIGDPLVDPATPETREAVAQLLEQTAAVSARLNGASLELSRGPVQGASYSLSVVAALKPDSPAVVVTMRRLSDGAESAPYSWLGRFSPELPTLLARAVFLQWKTFTGLASPAATEPPVVTAELPAALVQQYAYPWALAPRPGGTIVAAMGTSCVELDNALRVVDEPGKALGEGGLASFAIGLAVTPGGTVILKPAQGRDLWRVAPGSAAPQKVPTGGEVVTSSVAALPDGSIVLVDPIARKAYRLAQGKKRVEAALFANSFEYIAWLAAASDGTLWVYDHVLKAFRIMTADGEVADYMLPLVDPAKPLTPLSVAIAPDGGIVVLGTGRLARFLRDGTQVWSMDSLPGAESESLPQSGSVAVDWQRGLVYVADTTGRRIVQLMDTAYCRQKGIRNELQEALLAARGRREADEPAALAAEARLFDAARSPLMARAAWQKLADADPGNQEAAARLLAIETGELAAAAAALDAKAREVLAAVGIETARPTYVQAVQKYEALLAKAPGSAAARSAMERLKDLFSGNGGRAPSLRIQEATLADLFPSLMQRYAKVPVGSVTVRNPSQAEASAVRASVMIPRFMQFPSEAPTLASIAPGATATVALTLTLDQTVLELQEDMAVQALVEVTFLLDGAEQTVSRPVPVTIHRNTALTWEDTAKIASFITPNDETVNGFARRSLAPAGAEKSILLSAKLFQAIRVCDAIAARGVTYVADPASPISTTLGNAAVVDTVQFPRVTLFNRAGDCDDTTALLASALEAIGVQTAILTTPGHIFIAFDTGEPAESARFLSDPGLEVIGQGGRAWIPVETTSPLQKGFLPAWQAASELVRTYGAKGLLEFIPLADARASYPALALPPSTIAVADPAPSAVQAMYAASLAGFTARLYTARVAEAEAELKGLSGKQAAKQRVKLGILHAVFGRLPEAARAFETASKEAPAFASPYVNLANVRLVQQKPDAGLVAARAGLVKNPSSVPLNVAAARCLAAMGDRVKAGEHLARVRASDPDTAALYTAILGLDAPERAAGEGGSPAALLWDLD